MAGRLEGKRVVVLVAEGFEDLEFWVTVMRLREEGADVTIAGPTTAEVRGKNALTAAADVTVDDVLGQVFDAVVVPGGGRRTSSGGHRRSRTWCAARTSVARSSG